MRRMVTVLILVFACVLVAAAQEPSRSATAPAGPRPARVDITPAKAEVEVGQTVSFTAAGVDEAGARLPDARPSAWFSAPWDVGGADQNGVVIFYRPGTVRVGAIINGQTGFASVTVRPQTVARIDIEALAAPLPVGGSVPLRATARTAAGDPRREVELTWSCDSPAIATVDAAGTVTGLAPGRAIVRAAAGSGRASVIVEVVSDPVRRLTIAPRSSRVRTGDVVRFTAQAARGDGAPASPLALRWAVSGDGAMIDADGGFVAERPGSYVIIATSGERLATASVVAVPRDVARELEVVGRTPLEEFRMAEQWIVGNHAYASSLMAGRVWVYDISNPAAPVKVDSVAFDARILNDISTTPDGKIAVLSREGASSRKNGIVFLDTSDPAHPKIVSEYTETVTGGVHSAFIDGHYVYLTDNATGSMRVIDFKDVKAPKEVARWQVDEPLAKPLMTQDGVEFSSGRYLHDVYVKDGLCYLGYWRHGLVILDVGNGVKAGSPESPKFVSQLRFNYHELYGPGWLAGAHAVFRYRNYVFIGDEVFPAHFKLEEKLRFPVKGIVHVVDVSNPERPRKVAEYDVPEGGSHNMWVVDDVMYMGYYSAGARVVDVSGELRGNLYRQGREIASLWTGDPKGYVPNQPFTWGAQPHNGLIYFNDINTGIWITRLPPLKTRTTTEPQ